MNYLIISQPSLEYGWQLSAALWQLSSPASVQQSEGRETAHWIAPIQHSDGRVALPLPESDEFIHPDADLSVLQPFMDQLSVEDSESVIQMLTGYLGSRLPFANALANIPSLAPQIKTHEQMEVDGWFSSDL